MNKILFNKKAFLLALMFSVNANYMHVDRCVAASDAVCANAQLMQLEREKLDLSQNALTKASVAKIYDIDKQIYTTRLNMKKKIQPGKITDALSEFAKSKSFLAQYDASIGQKIAPYPYVSVMAMNDEIAQLRGSMRKDMEMLDVLMKSYFAVTKQVMQYSVLDDVKDKSGANSDFYAREKLVELFFNEIVKTLLSLDNQMMMLRMVLPGAGLEKIQPLAVLKEMRLHLRATSKLATRFTHRRFMDTSKVHSLKAKYVNQRKSLEEVTNSQHKLLQDLLAAPFMNVEVAPEESLWPIVASNSNAVS